MFFYRIDIFNSIAWSTQFWSLSWSGISRIQLTVIWVLMYLIFMWGNLYLWPEQWCLQGSEIIVGSTASASRRISCIDNWILFVWLWSLRPRRNVLLLPWSYCLIMFMRGSWSARIVYHVIGDRLLQYDPLKHVLSPCCLHLIQSYQKHGWFLLNRCPVISSCSRWGRLCFWLHCGLYYFLNTV